MVAFDCPSCKSYVYQGELLMILDGTVTFGNSCLDRAVELRGQPKTITKLLSDSSTGFLPFWRDKPLIGGLKCNFPVWLPIGHEIFKYANRSPVFLGKMDGVAKFAIDISEWLPNEDIASVGTFSDKSEQRFPGFSQDYRFSELRSVMTELDPNDAELIALGKALMHWHNNYEYCPTCGSTLSSSKCGWELKCVSCEKVQFPRIDPVVIMLITSGNSVLVGRSHFWPKHMYSLLAGFVEPGETIEGAVRRETFEEAGVKVSDVAYLCSQPWPFPGSLMFGCKGIAKSKKLNIDYEELEDAKWISKEKMVDIFLGRNKSMTPARHGSIAHYLLRIWLEGKI